MADKHFTRLLSSENGFNQMMQRFGVVTVMNVRVYEWFDFNHIDNIPISNTDLSTVVTPYDFYQGITNDFTPI